MMQDNIIRLYNNEYETVPSLLGDNVIDLIDQAFDLGMDKMYSRYYDDNEGCFVEAWFELTYKKKLGVVPVLLKEKKVGCL